MLRNSAWLAVLVGLCGAGLLETLAEDRFPVLQVGSETYSNVIVTTVTSTDIYFSHSRGMGTAKLKNLPPDLRKHFHFNPAKAGELEKKQQGDNLLFRENMAAKAAAAKQAQEVRAESAVRKEEIVVPKLYARSIKGQPAPDIAFEKWVTAAPDIAGKFLLIVFWNTTSEPCRQSIPHLNGLAARFRGQLVIVGLSNESEDDVRSFTSPQIDYSLAVDTRARALRSLRVEAIPHAILINPSGVVSFEGLPVYLTEQGLESIMVRYYNNQP